MPIFLLILVYALTVPIAMFVLYMLDREYFNEKDGNQNYIYWGIVWPMLVFMAAIVGVHLGTLWLWNHITGNKSPTDLIFIVLRKIKS